MLLQLYQPATAMTGALPSLREGTRLPSAPNIHVADAVEASNAIPDDQENLYFDRLQPMEMAVKTGVKIAGVTLLEQQGANEPVFVAGPQPPILRAMNTGSNLADLPPSVLEQQARGRAPYRAEVAPFTTEVQVTFTWFIRGINAALRMDYPRVAATDWKFIKTRGGVEN